MYASSQSFITWEQTEVFMANESTQNSPKKGNRSRTSNDLELLKIILDSDPALKRKVIRFMQKNYSKVIAQNSK